jgi:hypothetical protein
MSDERLEESDRSERGWNTASPSFAKVIEQLSETAIGEASVKQVGVQRCLYFWRIEPERISGYFSQAAVSNAKQRVIATAGNWSNVQIGEPVPDQIARAAETFDLRLGTESFGQLLIPQARTTPPRLVKSGLQSLRAASAWLSGLALVAGLTLSAYLVRVSVLARIRRSRRDAAVESKKE